MRWRAEDLADRMLAEGAVPSTIRNAIMPLRVIYRRALFEVHGLVAGDLTGGAAAGVISGDRERAQQD